MIGSALRSSIRLRLWVAASLPALMVILALLVGFADRQSKELTRMLTERARATAQQVASSAEFALFAGDTQSLQRLINNIQNADADIKGIAVVPLDGRFRVQTGTMTAEMPSAGVDVLTRMDQDLMVVAPVFASVLDHVDWFADNDSYVAASAGSLTGQVVVVFDLQTLRQRQTDLVQWALALTVLSLFFAAVVSISIAASVTGPVAAISRVVGRIGSGTLHARIDETKAGPLLQLARGINQMADRIAASQENLQLQVAQATDELRKQKEAAEMVARVDALTGVASRRAFTERAELEIQRALRYRQPLCVVMVDLDRFKRVNDTYGHAVGDSVLVAFAQAIMNEVREVDMVGRLGGEEFAILLPGISGEEGFGVAERMRLAVERRELMVGGQPLRFTASFGVAEFDGIELNMAGLLARADSALYNAKHTGRNKVVFADEAIPAFQDSQM